MPSSEKLLKVGNATRLHQHSSKKPTVQVSELASATSISRSLAKLAFLSYRGSGEVIHRLARIHLTPSSRARVARMVCPETRLWVKPAEEPMVATPTPRVT